jgi:hypothetical protein
MTSATLSSSVRRTKGDTRAPGTGIASTIAAAAHVSPKPTTEGGHAGARRASYSSPAYSPLDVIGDAAAVQDPSVATRVSRPSAYSMTSNAATRGCSAYSMCVSPRNP